MINRKTKTDFFQNLSPSGFDVKLCRELVFRIRDSKPAAHTLAIRTLSLSLFFFCSFSLGDTLNRRKIITVKAIYTDEQKRNRKKKQQKKNRKTTELQKAKKTKEKNKKQNKGEGEKEERK